MLRELFDKYHTDKGFAHQYERIYEPLLSPIRNDVRWVLEIGSGANASLQVWRDYFPSAIIVGLDIEPIDVHEERMLTLRGDATKHDQLTAFSIAHKVLWDVIIDDGSHDPLSQVLGIVWLWQFLRPGGIYVVEDIMHPESYPHFTCFQDAVIHDQRVLTADPYSVMLVARKRCLDV